MTDQYDWTRFQIHAYIAAAPEEVFHRWATADGLESFFIRSAEYSSADDRQRDPNGHQVVHGRRKGAVDLCGGSDLHDEPDHQTRRYRDQQLGAPQFEG